MNNQLAGSARVLMAPGGVCVCVTGLSPAWHAQATASRGARGVAQIVWAKGCGVDVPALCACEGFFL